MRRYSNDDLVRIEVSAHARDPRYAAAYGTHLVAMVAHVQMYRKLTDQIRRLGDKDLAATDHDVLATMLSNLLDIAEALHTMLEIDPGPPQAQDYLPVMPVRDK